MVAPLANRLNIRWYSIRKSPQPCDIDLKDVRIQKNILDLDKTVRKFKWIYYNICCEKKNRRITYL